MPDLDELRQRYQELGETIREQTRLRDADSDDYDFNVFDQAMLERDRIAREYQQAGGSLDDLRGQPEPSGAGGTGAAAEGNLPATEPTAPQIATSTSEQLTQQIEALEGQQPHPGVRLDTENNEVIGGTREQFDANREWREQLQQLEHERAAAQAEEAWNANGGPNSFTDSERADFARRQKEIEDLRKELDGVNQQVEHWEGQLEQARWQLEGNRTNEPGSGAAIAAGERYNAELRPLYAEQGRLQAELAQKYEGLANAVGEALGRQQDGAGVEIDLPSDRVGREEVQKAFIRRVLDRMGLPHAESEPKVEGQSCRAAVAGCAGAARRDVRAWAFAAGRMSVTGLSGNRWGRLAVRPRNADRWR